MQGAFLYRQSLKSILRSPATTNKPPLCCWTSSQVSPCRNKGSTLGNRGRFEVGKAVPRSLEGFGNCLCQSQAIRSTREGRRSKSKRLHIFHIWRAEVQARMTLLDFLESSSCSSQMGNSRRISQTEHTRTPLLCAGDGADTHLNHCSTEQKASSSLAKPYTKFTYTFQNKPQKRNKNCSLGSRFRSECS